MFVRECRFCENGIFIKHRELGIAPNVSFEIAVDQKVLRPHPLVTELDCLLMYQVKTMDVFGLGVMMYNILLPVPTLKFPVDGPFLEDKLLPAGIKISNGFQQLLLNMVSLHPDLRISVNNSLLTCQLILSQADFSSHVCTEVDCKNWLQQKR